MMALRAAAAAACVRRRRWRATLLLLLAVAALQLRLPRATDDVIDFPHHAPAALAHHLADFSNYQRADDTIGAWRVLEDGGNYTWWRYSVQFECGVRCGGLAELQAHALHAAAPRHGVAAHHVLQLRDRRCRTLPLVPWLAFCDEYQVEMEVRQLRAAAGSRLLRRTRSSCGVLSLLAGHCRAVADHTAITAALKPRESTV